MMDARFLLSLPRDISSFILSTFLNVGDIRAVDAAMCNRVSREVFLEVLQDESFVFASPDEKSVVSQHNLHWIFTRGVGLDAVDLSFRSDERLLKLWRTYIEKRGPQIKKLCAQKVRLDEWELIRASLASCPNLKHLVYQENEYNDKIVDSLATLCPKLENLDFFNPKRVEHSNSMLLNKGHLINNLGVYSDSLTQEMISATPNVTSATFSMGDHKPEQGLDFKNYDKISTLSIINALEGNHEIFAIPNVTTLFMGYYINYKGKRVDFDWVTNAWGKSLTSLSLSRYLGTDNVDGK